MYIYMYMYIYMTLYRYTLPGHTRDLLCGRVGGLSCSHLWRSLGSAPCTEDPIGY